jgi:hypothetical protein
MTDTDNEKSREEWLAEERARLEKGFSYEPQPTSGASKPSAGGQVLAGLGLGAGVVGGVVAEHPDSVSFEGVESAVIVNALKSGIADDDTRMQIEQSGESVVATILQSQDEQPHNFSPVLTVTLIEKAETLTVTMSKLNQDSVRGRLSDMGSTVLNQGRRVFFRRRRGPGGLLETADYVVEGIEDLVEDIQDLNLPSRVWVVIDRVGKAAEEAYLDEQRKKQEAQRQREAAERAWTHCEWCGHAYGDDEDHLTSCPTCGGARGPKPAWLK